MARNKMEDIRDHLIGAMEEMMSEDELSPERMERLKQTNEIGRTLVESAKAEALYLNSMAKLVRSSDNSVKARSNFFQIEESTSP